jgi:hypothetical protein
VSIGEFGHVQTRDIFVRFTTAGGCSVQALDLNLDRPLGPRVPVTSPDVLRRLLAYLGALPEALREYDRSHQSHGKGNVRIAIEPAARICCACVTETVSPLRSCRPRQPRVDFTAYRTGPAMVIMQMLDMQKNLTQP